MFESDNKSTEISITRDGSPTLFSMQFNEHYHSTNGAVTESMHVYINQNLVSHFRKEISILEFGYGTGLNAVLTAKYAEENALQVTYTTLELYPLSADALAQYSLKLPNGLRQLHGVICNAPWGIQYEISPFFSIKKLLLDFLSALPTQEYDSVFYDAFSPDAQPELWTESQFRRIYESCENGAVLTTYSAKGSVRRALQSSGWQVERLPGPPGKREMLRGIKRI
jgi:tRNA U34 5-methylaminomethyl-2-thiouridine-forming methyltransferase MnmC